LNLTKPTPGIARVQKTFDAYVLPLAEQSKASGKPYFESGFDPKAASYYTVRKQAQATAQDFHRYSFKTQEDLEAALKAYWTAQGQNDLAALAGPLAAIAAEIQSETHREEADVSPFIYVMF
jgi:hypothetical protein